MEKSDKPKRVHKPAHQRRTEIMHAATMIFAERGYQVADMQAVADAAGVGKGTVYRYFATKEALFTETLRYNLNCLRNAVDSAHECLEDPLEQLKAAMRAYLEFFEANPHLIDLFVQERVEFRKADQPSMYFADLLSGRDELLDLFNRIAEKYSLRDVDPEDLMNFCLDLMHGAAMAQIDPPFSNKRPSDRVDAFFDIYLHGILEP